MGRLLGGRGDQEIPLGGGPVMDVASGIKEAPRGLVWDAHGRLFFGGEDGRIWQVTTGGELAAVTAVGERELAHVLPCALPSGHVVLYTVRTSERAWGDETIVAHTIATGDSRVVLRDAVDARYLPTGHLVFMRRGTLFAVRFDPEQVAIQGPPVAVLDPVVQVLTGDYALDLTGAGQFAISPTGTLAWVPGAAAAYRSFALVTVDRHGQVAALPAPLRGYFAAVRLSPDGRRLAVTIPSLTEVGLWLYDIDRGLLTPLARGGEAFWPVWSPDGQRLAFSWISGGRWSLAAQPVDGASPPRELVAGILRPSSWSPDGRQIAVVARPHDIVIVALDDGKTGVQPLSETPDIFEGSPDFSPDGRRLAYVSNVSGRDEVYIRPYPGPGPSQQISTEGGDNLAWRSDGKELFFISPPNTMGKRRMMAVDTSVTSTRDMGGPRPLFEFDPADLAFINSPSRAYDVAPDGQRFYVTQVRTSPPRPVVMHVNLIVNWFEELKAKVPAGGVK